MGTKLHTSDNCLSLSCGEKHYGVLLSVNFEVVDGALIPVTVEILDGDDDDALFFFNEEWRNIGLELFPDDFAEKWEIPKESDEGKEFKVKGRMWTQLVGKSDDYGEYDVGFDFDDTIAS